MLCRWACSIVYDEGTHQDALTCFANVGLVVVAAGDNEGMLRVTVFSFALAPDERLRFSEGGP